MLDVAYPEGFAIAPGLPELRIAYDPSHPPYVAGELATMTFFAKIPHLGAGDELRMRAPGYVQAPQPTAF